MSPYGIHFRRYAVVTANSSIEGKSPAMPGEASRR